MNRIKYTLTEFNAHRVIQYSTEVSAEMEAACQEYGFKLDPTRTKWADSELINQDNIALDLLVKEIKRTHRLLIPASINGVSFYSNPTSYTVVIVEDQGYTGIFYKL